MFYTEPFEYMIIENCLSEDIFKDLLDQKDRLISNAKQIWNQYNNGVEDLYNSPYEKGDIFPFFNKQLIEKFSTAKSFDSKWALKRLEWSVQAPKFHMPRHIDNKSKIVVGILYVDPELNQGTTLFGKSDKQLEIPWKPNSMFIHCPRKGTDHSYYNPSPIHYRLTLRVIVQDTKRMEINEDKGINEVKDSFSNSVFRLT
jgi:hypothetical protein